MAKKSSEYWQDRNRQTQETLLAKSTEETNAALAKYYTNTSKSILTSFGRTYDHIQRMRDAGMEPTPADLYKLDRYWKLQNELQKLSQTMGNDEVATLSRRFTALYKQVYDELALPSDMFPAASALAPAADQAINRIWCADGESWSTRVWKSSSLLAESLNSELVTAVLAGYSTEKLKENLMYRFAVSYNEAARLVRTEMCHITTQAACDRYKDSGLLMYEFYGGGCAQCKTCQELDGKRFYLAQMQPGVNAPPMHPNDKCCVLPVLDK